MPFFLRGYVLFIQKIYHTMCGIGLPKEFIHSQPRVPIEAAADFFTSQNAKKNPLRWGIQILKSPPGRIIAMARRIDWTRSCTCWTCAPIFPCAATAIASPKNTKTLGLLKVQKEKVTHKYSPNAGEQWWFKNPMVVESVKNHKNRFASGHCKSNTDIPRDSRLGSGL